MYHKRHVCFVSNIWGSLQGRGGAEVTTLPIGQKKKKHQYGKGRAEKLHYAQQGATVLSKGSPFLGEEVEGTTLPMRQKKKKHP